MEGTVYLVKASVRAAFAEGGVENIFKGKLENKKIRGP